MGLEIQPILFILILILAFVLFSREIFPLEISGLFILVTLVFSGLLDGREALSSFGNESIILIGSLFVLIAGLNKTGLINKFEKQLLRITGSSRLISLTVVLVLVAFVSAFVSNTATLAVTIPIVVSLAEKYGESPRRWLMPVAFASVLGGMNTLVGTSTNIIISSLLPEYGIEELGLFTTATVGFPILVLGLVFLIFFSGLLLGAGKTPGESIGVKYGIRPYTAELTVRKDSPLCHRTIANSPLFSDAEITVLGVMRPGQRTLIPTANLLILPEDRLIVNGDIEKLNETLEKNGLEFHDEIRPDEESSTEDEEKNGRKERPEPPELGFHEVLVNARSMLNNRTPKEVNLRGRYRLSLIAINRQGATFRSKLSDIRIMAGDILVVQFLNHMDNSILDSLGLVPLNELDAEQLKGGRRRAKLAPHALIIFVLALLVGSVTKFPLAITCLAGCVLMVMLQIIRPAEAYEAVEWRVLLFIASVLCLGKAMESSGTAALLAEWLASIFATMDPVYAVSFFFLITVVMTQLLSNQATAVVMIPVAVNTAAAINLEPMAFVMAVTMAASCCFITPFEPAFMLVYGPGRYKFSDFFRLGIVLCIMAIIMSLYIIPRAWPV